MDRVTPELLEALTIIGDKTPSTPLQQGGHCDGWSRESWHLLLLILSSSPRRRLLATLDQVSGGAVTRPSTSFEIKSTNPQDCEASGVRGDVA